MTTAAGRLIAIEGGDGAGKSTQAARLARAIGTELTREPGGTPLGEAVRALLLEPSTGPTEARTEVLLTLAARSQHVAERIVPALQAGHHVVVDRFSMSTIAYQGYGRQLEIERVRRLCDFATGGLWPDLNVLIDVPVAVGAARRRGRPDRFESESEDFHHRIRQGYLLEAARDEARFFIVDGTSAPEEVSVTILAGVRARLGLDAEVTG